MDLARQRQVALDGALVAARGGLGRCFALEHPGQPGAGVVLGAPDRARLLGRIAAEDGDQEGVDRHVLHLLQRLLEALAVAAVGVGEHGDAALAGAVLPDQRVLERQGREVHAVDLGHALLGQVLPGLDVDQLALDQVGAGGVGVAQLVADADLPQPRHRRGAHLVDLGRIGHALGKGLADDGLVGEGGQAGGGQQAGHQRAEGKGRHDENRLGFKARAHAGSTSASREGVGSGHPGRGCAGPGRRWTGGQTGAAGRRSARPSRVSAPGVRGHSASAGARRRASARLHARPAPASARPHRPGPG
mmetsp:Transcript_15313/g.36478  ORF Transcript_15313/g.36478 Transcript_15313/m.36478 type:complete len:304 (+) Transcript_15313:1382-2293(+)